MYTHSATAILKKQKGCYHIILAGYPNVKP